MIQIIKNRFIGKESSHICFAPKTLIMATIIIPIIVIFGRIADFELVFILFTFEIICWILLIRNRIKVTNKGIYYHKKYFLWEEIKTIGITVTTRNVPHKFYNKIIYISKHSHEKSVHILDRRQYSEVKEPKDVEIIDFSFGGKPKYLITASFNRRLIHHIMAYWGKDIKNLNETTGWYSYVKLYNFLHKDRKSCRGRKET